MTKLVCLMPTYNKEKTIAKAIESVIIQKTNFDYKLIILDDCSKDDSNKIAQEYKEKYPSKIEIVRNEQNLGLLKSIFNGYKLLKGAEYFCVLDADDYYTYDKKFFDAVNYLDKHKNYSMYMTNVLVHTSKAEYPLYDGNIKKLDFDFWDRKFGKSIFIQTSGVVYRNVYFKNGYNKDFENIFNFSFPEAFRADGFRLEWYLKAGKAHFENKFESVYNFDDGIWSSLNQAEQWLNNAKMFYSCFEFFKEDKMYYISRARGIYAQAIKEFSNVSAEEFAKNQELITKLGFLLLQKQKTPYSRTINFLISLIPNKKLRHILREQRSI